MAPKKKGNKKSNDDWEADLGETVDPIAAATQEAKQTEAVQDAAEEETGGGGGLLAALKKNKSKKQKKGKPVQEDYLDGEDPPTVDGATANGVEETAEKLEGQAPEEANADDLFAAQSTKKQKSEKSKPTKPAAAAKDIEEESDEEGGGLKSKKEKDREKKEREKQRKKEQVCHIVNVFGSGTLVLSCLIIRSRPLRKRPLPLHQRPKPSL